ncbi:MAG TPA: alkaline phosphatase family protein [Candidatus Dormibacteraeota bacterium]|nr:alkaline phosphatase family protein [Candidatus Dormibacteraeota bacterium]
MRLGVVMLAGVVFVACTAQPARQAHAPRSQPPSPVISPSPEPDPSPIAEAPPQPPHVFVIVLENRSAAQVEGSSYIGQLSAQYGVATNYRGISHPSLPNYLAMTSGTTWDIADDGWHSLPAGGLGAQLTAAGIDWRAYMEGMNSGCYRSGYPYALKHNPFAYYGGTCPSQVVPFSQFASDMSGNVPQFVWITPDLCNDGHDCSNETVNTWLSQTVPTILDTDAWKSGGVLFITWDEGEDSGNSVLTLVIHPNPMIHKSGNAYNHYSMLATIEDLLGLQRLGHAAQAAPMTDLLATTPQPTPSGPRS